VALTDWSAGMLRIVTGDLFLSSGIHSTLMGQCERLLHTACHECVRVVCIRFLLYDVHGFELSRLIDMSNHLSCSC
jgi:hypothetical protein